MNCTHSRSCAQSGPSCTPKPRSRGQYTEDQEAYLKSVFYKESKFPSTHRRAEIAALLQKTPRQVQVWFQNHRQRDTKYPVLCLLLCTTFVLKHFKDTSVEDTLEKVIKMDGTTVYHLSLLAIAQMDAADADFICSFAE